MQYLPLSVHLVEKLKDGVIKLNGHGQVVLANAAARPWLRMCQTEKAKIDTAIASLSSSNDSSVVRLDLGSECFTCPDADVEIWLGRDTVSGFVMLISEKPSAAESSFGQGSTVLQLADDVILEEMSAISVMLDDFRKIAGKDGTLPEEVENLSALLQELYQLAANFKPRKSLPNDRFGMAPLLDEIVAEITGAANMSGTQYRVSEVHHVGQIYGNREWLKYALSTMLHILGVSCPAGFEVDVTLRQLGDFLVLRGSAKLNRDRSQAILGTRGSEFVGNVSPSGDGARLRLCKRIVQLHGGVLKLETSESLQLETFTMSLPTGLSPDQRRPACGDCPMSRQAIQLAEDLSTLLTRQLVQERRTH